MDIPIPADKYYSTWIMLHQTRDAIFKAREKELARYGITTMEAGVLFIIQNIGDEATPAEISRWIFRQPHTVSSLLRKMEKKGLIRQTKDLPKKNMIRVNLTEKGKEALVKSFKRQAIHGVLSTFSEKELRQLYSYLKKLRDKATKRLKIDYKLPYPTKDVF